MESAATIDCLRCGTCCVAPDISTLGKRAGQRCRHLSENLSCSIYDKRPAVCRGYRPDEICALIAAATLEERVENYLRLFSLTPAPLPEGEGQGRREGLGVLSQQVGN